MEGSLPSELDRVKGPVRREPAAGAYNLGSPPPTRVADSHRRDQGVERPATMRGTPQAMRAINDGSALRLLLEHGRLSRTELGALTGLSKPTASQTLTRLERAGLVMSVGPATDGTPGRAAELYEINPSAGYAVGFDVEPGLV